MDSDDISIKNLMKARTVTDSKRRFELAIKLLNEANEKARKQLDDIALSFDKLGGDT